MTEDLPAPGPLQRRIRVELGKRAYDVHVGPGLLARASGLLDRTLGRVRFAVVTDENVEAAGHIAALQRALGDAGGLVGVVLVKPGEPSKSLAELGRVAEALLAMGIERRDVVIALGGGVIGDLTGFAASVLRRGVRFVQIPTSLLAHVDSSVGGKTGINTAQGKNLIGAFHQPSLVLADTDVLATLPDRQMRAGYAEIAKHGLLGDAAYFAWLEANGTAALGRSTPALVHAIARSVEMKAQIVARDETEQGDRMLLNLGHTFGHALEAWAGYSDRLLHGEAVAIGTAQAFRFSEALGLCPKGSAERVVQHLTAVGLPSAIAHIPGATRPVREELLALMEQDKKVQGGRLTFILARDIGRAFVARDIERSAVERFIDGELLVRG